MPSNVPGIVVPTYESVDDISLARLLQPILAGLTGLPGTSVRPLWQQNPPPMPDHDTNWLAFGIEGRTADANAYLQPGAADARLYRHEDINWLVSCYGPDALTNAGRIRDGLELSQNRAGLALSGMAFIAADDIVNLAEVVNGRFYSRADLVLQMRREILRGYAILPLDGAAVDILADDAESQPLEKQITVENPE